MINAYVIIVVIVSIIYFALCMLRDNVSKQSTTFDESKLRINGPPKSRNIGENIMYNVIIDMFPNYKWIQSDRSLTFLYNPYTKRPLEIDVSCHDLRLGFEYQGEQHYKYLPHFDKNNEGVDFFYKSRMRDVVKKEILSQNGWTLIDVPHTLRNYKSNAVTYRNIYEYIKDKLYENKIILGK